MLTRRSLFVLPALLAAPAIVRAASLMKVSAPKPAWEIIGGPGPINFQFVPPDELWWSYYVSPKEMLAACSLYARDPAEQHLADKMTALMRQIV